MRRPIILSTALLVGATTALVPSSASAASTQFGNGCVASDYAENVTLLAIAGAPGNPLPAAAPISGVATKATITLPAEAGAGPYPVKVKMARPAGAPNQYTVSAESTLIPTSAGIQTADIRVPVQAGDLPGLGGPGALVCDTGNPADVIAGFAGDVAAGSTATASGTESGASTPVVVTVEPDADKDGYGDVTQDRCPQSASVQGECPVIKLDSISFARDGSILVLVGTSEKAKVKVTGKATVNGKTLKLGGAKKKLKPGKLGRYKVALPPALKAALAQLPRGKFIKVTFTASATDVAGRKSKDTSSVRLYGTR